MNLFLLTALQDIKASEKGKQTRLLYSDGTECNLDKRQKIWLIDVIALRFHKHQSRQDILFYWL